MQFGENTDIVDNVDEKAVDPVDAPKPKPDISQL